MSKYKPKLPRYNSECCEQVMPVSVVPICAISCCIPVPIVQLAPCPPPPEPLPYPSCPEPEYPPCPEPKPYPIFPTRPPSDKPPIIVPLQILKYCEDKTYQPGTIMLQTTESLPDGFLVCDGSERAIADYEQLFYAIGTYYGAGSSPETFNLPRITNDCDLSEIFIIKT
jgi:hypothetical protein